MIVFDMNETTLDLAPVREAVDTVAGEAGGFTVWFQKLLQLSMTVTAAKMDFVGFGTLARHALDAVLDAEGSAETGDEWSIVAAAFGRLEAYPDVKPGLERLRTAGHSTMALTNTELDRVQSQCENAGLTDLFDHTVSVEAVSSYKPAAAAYEHAIELAGVDPTDMWMVACHDWDLAGARAVGLRTAFVARPGMSYAPTYPAPDLFVAHFGELADQIT
ncbi:MAG: haloacid dehalogenase type II [Acidimicrobiia bacterium]|nr:haloacid dehalogenase type II [Acidimicrobiia bacterium]